MSAPASRVAAIVLAAGEATRYGRQKLLAPFHGRPLLAHAIAAASASACAPVVVVLGSDADDIAIAVTLGRARVVRNPDFASGQASSLRAGIRAAADADAVVVVLGDQPLLTGAILDALVARQRGTGSPAVVSVQDGRRSPPTLLHRDLYPLVEALRGDAGARELLARRSDVAQLDVPAALGRLDDVDTSDDLERLQR